jgi:hypothetical protein
VATGFAASTGALVLGILAAAWLLPKQPRTPPQSDERPPAGENDVVSADPARSC